MTKIGVFDSGVGGLSVVQAIEAALPGYEIVFANDTQHLPYGTKAPEQLLTYVLPILQDLEKQGCQVIVMACNTVSTTLITELRQNLTIPLIAMEPMIKPAVEKSKSNKIAVCATPTTLRSERYKWLKDTYAKDIEVLEPDCSDWSYLIENKKLDREHITKHIDEVCKQGADVIVLGCTHYHWIEDLIKDIAGKRATVLQPERPVIEQLKRVLAELERPS